MRGRADGLLPESCGMSRCVRSGGSVWSVRSELVGFGKDRENCEKGSKDESVHDAFEFWTHEMFLG